MNGWYGQAKQALKNIIKHHSQLGVQRLEPEMTTKKGQLKVSRGARLVKIYCDDLAALENLTAVNAIYFNH